MTRFKRMLLVAGPPCLLLLFVGIRFWGGFESVQEEGMPASSENLPFASNTDNASVIDESLRVSSETGKSQDLAQPAGGVAADGSSVPVSVTKPDSISQALLDWTRNYALASTSRMVGN